MIGLSYAGGSIHVLTPVRFTVQRMMVAVIFIAALLGTFEAGRRWERDQVGGEPSRYRQSGT